MKALFLAFMVWCPTPMLACELALVLAVDVSGSVDAIEYDAQMSGLALALQDGVIADALVDQAAKVTLIQWSGSTRQRQTLPWAQMQSYEDVLRLSDQIAKDPRVWRNFSTAIGEALEASLEALEEVAGCKRKVIDVSGDGVSNEGASPGEYHAQLKAMGVIVNGLAIETDDADLTAYFYEELILGEGAFVVTSYGFEDYPAQIKRKLQRETTKQVAVLGEKTVSR